MIHTKVSEFLVIVVVTAILTDILLHYVEDKDMKPVASVVKSVKAKPLKKIIECIDKVEYIVRGSNRTHKYGMAHWKPDGTLYTCGDP